MVGAVVSTDVGVRERKKRATRAQLEEAAFSLFARQGYEATTVDEISEAAQVSPRTFFRYFATKEDVIFGDQAGDLDQLRLAMQHGPGEDGDVVRDGLMAFSRILDERRDDVLGRRQLIVDNPVLQGRVLRLESAWAGAVADILAARAGQGDPTFEQQVLASCAVTVLSAAVQAWHAAGADGPLVDYTQRALDTVGSCLG
jgi:AcrR family transcriptional regulator